MASKTGEDIIMRLLSALLVAASLTVTASHAADIAMSSKELRVGKTNIFCFQMPCPWRGIATADSPRVVPADLIWSHQTLPPLAGSSGDRQRIITAWNSDQCLIIHGRFTDGVLQVDRIVEECA